MRTRSFRYCMLIGAAALAGVAVYYFVTYVAVGIALSNNGIQPFYRQSIRALWLGFGCQSLLLALLYAIVAWRPHAVSREVIVICGLLQLVEAVLLFAFSGNHVAEALLAAAAVFVLIGSVLWPRKLAATDGAAFSGPKN
jgi:hypothetical protein